MKSSPRPTSSSRLVSRAARSARRSRLSPPGRPRSSSTSTGSDASCSATRRPIRRARSSPGSRRTTTSRRCSAGVARRRRRLRPHPRSVRPAYWRAGFELVNVGQRRDCRTKAGPARSGRCWARTSSSGGRTTTSKRRMQRCREQRLPVDGEHLRRLAASRLTPTRRRRSSSRSPWRVATSAKPAAASGVGASASARSSSGSPRSTRTPRSRSASGPISSSSSP